MGETVTKKKGRPPKADTGALETPAVERDLRRSHRRRNVKYFFDLDDYFDDDELFENDEDQRRRRKKLKLLLKLESDKELESATPQPSRTRRVDHLPATSSSSFEYGGKPSKKTKINDEIDEGIDDETDEVNAGDSYNDENDEVRDKKPEPIAQDSPSGTPAEAPSGLPLPDKKALELILDKLQKKDIYGVYAEPVDSEELPDYHDMIKHPMNFATVRSKLGNGSYATLEQFEHDVFLICSNAMQYNPSDTIYHKQAWSIKELATKKFHRIRLNAECSEKDVKPDQKMRSSSTLNKQVKNPVSRKVQESLGSDFSSGATLATAFDMHNAPNMRQTVGWVRPDNSDEGYSFLNDNNLYKGDESLPGKGPLSRFGRKSFLHYETRRATYITSLTHPVTGSDTIFSTFEGESKQLVPVGLYSDNSYARSLARFAATLGSVAWKFASKRIEQALPQGFKFGQGWVGEYEPLPTPVVMLKECTLKQPPFFTEVLPAADPQKFKNVPMVAVSSKRSPLIGPAAMTPPAPSITASLPVKEHPIRARILEPSFFLSPGIKPSGSANLSNQHQNSQSRTSHESDKKVLKHFESKNPLSFNKNSVETIGDKQISRISEMEASRSMEFISRYMNLSPYETSKQTDNNGVAVGGLPNGKVVGNRLYSNTMASSSSDLAKAAINYPRDHQGQGLSDQVQSMRMLAQIQPTSSNQLWAPSSSGHDSNIASVAAASAWMSVGAGGFRPAVENRNLHKNWIHSDSTHDIQTRNRGEMTAFGGMHVLQPDKNSSPLHAFVAQSPLAFGVGNEIQFHSQPMIPTHLTAADLSRFELQSDGRNLSPLMHSWQKQESFSPDSNISFQSSRSPGMSSPGILVDSRQPDLALQL